VTLLECVHHASLQNHHILQIGSLSFVKGIDLTKEFSKEKDKEEIEAKPWYKVNK
jgi:hypothetical protein